MSIFVACRTFKNRCTVAPGTLAGSSVPAQSKMKTSHVSSMHFFTTAFQTIASGGNIVDVHTVMVSLGGSDLLAALYSTVGSALCQAFWMVNCRWALANTCGSAWGIAFSVSSSVSDDESRGCIHCCQNGIHDAEDPAPQDRHVDDVFEYEEQDEEYGASPHEFVVHFFVLCGDERVNNF